MKLWKKAIVIFLTLVMVFSVAGCGKGGNNNTATDGQGTSGASKATPSAQAEAKKEPVTLEWYYHGNGMQKDTQMVEDKLNEMLKSYEGLEHVTVHLNCFVANEYQNAVVLAQSAGKQIDILNTVNIQFPVEVENGTYLPLNDYVASLPDLKNALPEWLWNLGSIDGNIYIVPHYQRAANMMYWITPKAWVDKYGDVQKFTQMLQDPATAPRDLADLMEKYLTDIRAGEGGQRYMNPFTEFYGSDFGVTPYFDNLYDKNMYVKFAGEKKVKFMPTQEGMEEVYAIAAEEYDKGLIHPDILTISAPDGNMDDYRKQNMMNDISFVYTIQNGIGDAQTASNTFTKTYGFDCVAIPLKTEYYVARSWAAGGDGITASSEHPEEAIKFIEAMNTEKGKDLYNLVVYGIEGVHYDKVDEDTIHTKEYDATQAGLDVSYGAMKWVMGNTFNAYLNQGCAEGENEISLEINENPNNKVSDLSGFNISIANVETQIEQVKAVWNEYRLAISGGVMGASGYKAYYDEYVNKLEAAGLSKILADFQSQVDAFYASK